MLYREYLFYGGDDTISDGEKWWCWAWEKVCNVSSPYGDDGDDGDDEEKWWYWAWEKVQRSQYLAMHGKDHDKKSIHGKIHDKNFLPWIK